MIKVNIKIRSLSDEMCSLLEGDGMHICTSINKKVSLKF